MGSCGLKPAQLRARRGTPGRPRLHPICPYDSRSGICHLACARIGAKSIRWCLKAFHRAAEPYWIPVPDFDHRRTKACVAAELVPEVNADKGARACPMSTPAWWCAAHRRRRGLAARPGCHGITGDGRRRQACHSRKPWTRKDLFSTRPAHRRSQRACSTPRGYRCRRP